MIQKSTTSPLLIFGTRHGTIYNLTPKNLPALLPAVQICYGDIHDSSYTLSQLPEGMSFKKFLGFPQNALTYLTPYDHSKNDCMTGCQNNSKVKIKSSKGYTEITADLYDKMIDLIKPDIFVGLTQYPSLQKDHSEESNKSHKRAICKTKSYLEKSKFTNSLQNKETSEGKIPLRLAAVHGGKNISLIQRSLLQVFDHAIDGIVLCDVCQNQTLEEREQIYNTILKTIEQETQRKESYFYGKKMKLSLAGLGKIQDIEHAMNFGFQMFQVNYPFKLAEQQKALVFDNGKYIARDPVKRPQLKPLQQLCACQTCLNYSEAYIFHLIECFEMTGKILLSIHNMHVYQKWLEGYQNKE